ncbi:TIR domain-containing protein [uncultured Roseobacter sp.]|uniref:TIR domain-containing protein n=1 Tax=uncultured Roseobacter sp. TaxID=114847 RepID=UPI002637B1F3|nr:TIR domain-containing protein [uncultured Roseobacter sp.]
MKYTSVINVFISHSWRYSNHYERLAGWLFETQWGNERTSLQFIDKSIPESSPVHSAVNDQELAMAIFQRIDQSDVVVIPTGMYANYSRWIKTEIDGAQAFRRPIVAVDLWGADRKSSIVSKAANEIVGWSGKSVVNSSWRQSGK